ncbi:MAG: hypothetical protein LBG52_03860 [Candidatus Peribacteria bacterium]|nr:hypothetical protein [Candidatus Peribacteria bacterium]
MVLVQLSFTPLVVIAGIQRRSQEGLKGGFESLGMVDFEVEIQILSKVVSTMAPSNHVPEKSTIII